MESWRVSVVIPTWNRAALVERAVASVLAQTRPAAEVIVVDDGSSDDTRARLAARFPTVRCLTTAHRGVSAARNAGIAAARGRWIAFLDSDDAWLPPKLEGQLTALAGAPDHRICHCDEIWIRDGRRVNPRRRHAKHGGWIFQRCLPLCAISPSAALVERALLDQLGGFDEDLPACEDYDLWLRICAREPVCYVDEKLVLKYGGHADQLSRTVPALDGYRLRALTKILDAGVLGGEDRRAALQTLHRKASVYAKGAARRGRQGEASAVLALCARLGAPVPDLSVPDGTVPDDVAPHGAVPDFAAGAGRAEP